MSARVKRGGVPRAVALAGGAFVALLVARVLSRALAVGVSAPAPHSLRGPDVDASGNVPAGAATGPWADEATRGAAAVAAARAANPPLLDGWCPPDVVTPGADAPAASVFAFGWEVGRAADVAALACNWTTVGYESLGGRTMRACVGDPGPDGDYMSAHLVSAGGFFTADFAAELRDFELCPPAAPFVLDVGANLGSFAFLALQLGCTVIAVEPTLQNAGRLVRTLAANPALAGRLHVLRNAAGAVRGDVRIAFEPLNSGGSHVVADGGDGGGGGDVVAGVVLDDLFFASGDGGGGAPRWRGPDTIVHPATGLPPAPADFNFVKVDAEGFDLRVLHGLRRSLAAGLAGGGMTLELHPPVDKCDALAFVEWAAAAGFAYFNSEATGVRGSRWLTPARFRRQLYMSTRGDEFSLVPTFQDEFGGVFVRGNMRARAEKLFPMPADE